MPENPRRLAAAFAGMLRATGLERAGAHQLQQMRMAFYGGARAYSSIVMLEADDGDDATDADLKLMADLDEEMEEFALELPGTGWQVLQ